MWDRGREAFEQAGDVVGAAGMTHNIGEQLSNLGRLEEAEARQTEARRIWTAARYTLGAAAATSGLGRTLARMGRDAEATAHLTEALHTFAGLGRGMEVVETEARLVEAHVLAGRWSEALVLADASLARAEGAEYAEFVAAFHRGRPRALIGIGNAEAARVALEQSMTSARAAGLEFEAASTLAVRALVQEDAADADADREAAHKIFAEIGASPTWLPLSSPR